MHVSFTFGHREILRILAVLVAFELVLIFAFLLDHFIGVPSWTIHRLLNVDFENSIATWMSTIQLAVAGILVGLALLRRDRRYDPAAWFIACISALLLAMSMDEQLQLHEAVTQWAAHNDSVPSHLGNQIILIAPLLGFGLLLTVLSWRQLEILWRGHRPALLLMTAGIIAFFAGAVGLDTIGHMYLQDGSLPYILEVAAEEFLELLGGTLMMLGGALFALTDAEQARHALARQSHRVADGASRELLSPQVQNRS